MRSMTWHIFAAYALMPPTHYVSKLIFDALLSTNSFTNKLNFYFRKTKILGRANKAMKIPYFEFFSIFDYFWDFQACTWFRRENARNFWATFLVR